jgi:hypothetical protein
MYKKHLGKFPLLVSYNEFAGKLMEASLDGSVARTKIK